MRVLAALGCVQFLLVSSLTGGVQAAPFEQEMFGHEVRVERIQDQDHLIIDTRPLHQNAYITLSSVRIVDGTPVVIGESSQGGNACEGSQFVISFPATGRPRLDGPLPTCSYTDVKAIAGGLQFETPAVPGTDGERWSWTPAGGFEKAANVALQVQPGDGWARLRERTLQHPSQVMTYGGITEQITNLLGRDRRAYEQIISGVGSGQFHGDDYVGTACAPHSCGDVEALIYLDSSARTAYLAWKPRDHKIIVRPQVQQWPEKAKIHLRQWAAQWQ